MLSRLSSAVARAAPLRAAPAAALRAPPARSMCVAISDLSDEALLTRIQEGEIPHHTLEKTLGDKARAVSVRRQFIEQSLAAADSGRESARSLDELPSGEFDSATFYENIFGTNCETPIGYVPLPVGVVGPLSVNDETYFVPMATTEGALVASTNRGARAISLSGGARAVVLRDGMTRAPVAKLPSVEQAAEVKRFVDDPQNFASLQRAFNATTRFGRLESVLATVAGRRIFLRFRCATGDAMGMNMVSKGVDAAMIELLNEFPAMRLIAISGNFCSDKKPSAINWVEGRGKSVSCEAVLSQDVVERVLKTTVDDLVELNISKNLVGSAMAGSIGGNNAHAANVVSAFFLATGQDPAQNVESATCMTLLEREGDDLHISCTMPSIEVGTVGGGTTLQAQRACLDMLGFRGASAENPGDNARALSQVLCATVMAGEISLLSALASGHLVSAHMDLGRK